MEIDPFLGKWSKVREMCESAGKKRKVHFPKLIKHMPESRILLNILKKKSASHIYNSYLTISEQFTSTNPPRFGSEPQNQPFAHTLRPLHHQQDKSASPKPSHCHSPKATKAMFHTQEIPSTIPSKK